MTTETATTRQVREYWEQASCGTGKTSRPKFSREYFEEIEAFRYSVEPFIHEFAQFSRWNGKDVLEVGVGAGTDFLQFVRSGARAHGVDLTDEALANVEHRLTTYGLKAADLRRCNAEQLPYPPDTFDLVYSWGVIHHAEDMFRVFAEIYRVTRPGGTIKIMIYNRASLWAWYLAIRYAIPRGHVLDARRWALAHHQESFQTKAYTEAEIRAFLRDYLHEGLQFSFFDQHVRPDARLSGIRTLVEKASPSRLRWYMAVQFRKTERAASGKVTS
jgi:ubiquinone/menaquinone biosynthesis C-methylase UbiE